MAGNGLNSESPDCPLCLEPLGWDDINFYPCSCRYQICRFCWHRIRTDENGLCPHCREPYPENPAEYTPPSQEQLAKLKSEKRQKTVEKRQKLVDSRKNLASVRVVQKNLVFVIGLSPRLADPEVLKKNEYFGKYGRIYKVVINNHTVYNGAQGPSVSAYVTYYRSEDASKAIQAVNNAYIDGRYLKVSFGTTKYCTYFLRGTQCTKPDCMYLHALGDNEASFTKEDMQMGKHQVFESATLAATNPPAKEQTGSRKQPLKTVVVSSATTADASESILPATASWASLSKIPGSIELQPTQQPPFQVYSHSSSKEPKSHSNSIVPHSINSGLISNGPHSYSTDIESHTSNSVGDSHTYSRSHSHSSDSGSHTSSSVSHSNTIEELQSSVSGGSNSHLNSGFHPTNSGSHSISVGSRSANSGLHPSTGSGSHSHTTSGSHSHSHSTGGTHSHSTGGSHSHSSSSSKESSGSSKTHQLHSSTSSKHTHSQPQQHAHGHKTHSHSSGSHSHSSSSGSHSQHAHGTHSHASYSKHSSHSHSSHGGSSGHTKHAHKSADSSAHRSDSDRERTSKSSRSSGLTSPSSEPSKRHSSRDRVSEHRHSRGGSSSKSNTPSQSPKSSMSTSSSSGSLKLLQQDCGSDSKSSGSGGGGGGESGEVKQAHSVEKLSSEGGSGGGSLVLESMEDWEEESSLDSCVAGAAEGSRDDGVGGDRVAAHTPPSGLRKTQDEEPSGTAVNVIPVLSAAGSGQFGALGVTWSTQAPNLTHPPPQPEDDLGFDPWDESNKGLADLLETEENSTTTMPRCIGKEKRNSKRQQQRDASNGIPEQAQGREKLEAKDTISREGEVLSSSATVASWQDEFRSVFPNVNISFSDPWTSSSKPRTDNKASSLHHAVEDTTGYNTTPLAPTLAYVYPQLVATSLSLNPSSATTNASQSSFVETKLPSEEGQGRSEWPDFSDSSIGGGTSGQLQQQQQQQQQQQNSWPADGSINRDSSSTGNGPPPPPPGFTAKGKDSSGPNTLSNSVNHSFWANTTGQVGHMYHNQLMQSWAHYMHLKAVPPQQLSRNQQQLLAQQQQYLARAQQALLMQGHPFLQATMGMQIRPGVVGVNMGHTAVHSGTPASLGHTAHAVNGGASGQVIPSTSSVSGQVTMTVPTSATKHEMTIGSDEKVQTQPGSLYRIVEQNIRNKPDMTKLPRTTKKKSTLK